MVLLDYFANKSNTFLSLYPSLALPFPPWVSTSSYPGYQDTAIKGTLSSLKIESWNEFCQEKISLRSGLILKWMTNDGAVILVERPPTPFSDALMSFLLKKRTCNIFQAKHLYSSVILQKPDRGQIYYWSNQTCSVHDFGTSGVIWGDLGTFWSDFRMQNHSV